MILVVCECETVKPGLLVEVHQHSLFQLILSVVDGDGVVVAIQSVDQRLDGRLVQVTQHVGGLSGRVKIITNRKKGPRPQPKGRSGTFK